MSNVAAGKKTDDDGEVLNDVEKTLNYYGIALRNSKKEFRNFEEVLDEVAEKWDKFSSTEQGHISSAFAGTRQIENFRAMMNNWGEVQELTKVAADSTGSATERMGTYLDSVEAKTNNLKSAWEGFILSLNQSDSYKKFLDMLTNFLEKLQYVDWERVIETLGKFLAMAALTKVIGSLAKAIASLKTAFAAGGTIGGFGALLTGVLPKLLSIIGVIDAVITGIKSVEESSELAIKQTKEDIKALDEEKNDVTELAKTYNTLKSKQSVYGLATDEKQKLVDVSKELVEKYGLEYTGIDNLTGAYVLAKDAVKDYTNALNEEQKAYTQKEKEERRKSIDSRLSTLGIKDKQFLEANSKRKLGKDFDSEVYATYTKERNSIASEIQEQMKTYFSDNVSDTTKNLILDEISSNINTLDSSGIKEKYTDEYLSQLNTFAVGYDNVISDIRKTEEKYINIIDKNGVLNLTEVDGYKKALEEKAALYQEMLNKNLISTEEYNTQIKNMEDDINSRLDFALKAISDNLGETSTKFDTVAGNVLNLTSEFKKGQKSISDYIISLGELSTALDFKDVFGDNTEAGLQFFGTIANQLTNVLNLIKSNYTSGDYKNNNEYINDLIAWGTTFQNVGNKMRSIEGGKTSGFKNGNGVEVNEDNTIATITKDGQQSYIMTRDTYNRQQELQNTVTDAKALWDTFKDSGRVNYDLARKLTGKVFLQGQEGYDWFIDRANKNLVEQGTEGLGIQDFIDLFRDDESKMDREAINEFIRDYNAANKVETQQEKDEIWNKSVNRYNEGNTKIVDDQQSVDEYTKKVEELNGQLTDYKKHLTDLKEDKSPLKWMHKGEEKEYAKKIEETQKQLDEYTEKLEKAKDEQNTFENAVEDAKQGVENENDELSNAGNDIAKYIQNLKDLQDSISAIEGINAGTIVEGTEEFNNALTTIISDVQSQMKDLNGEITQDMKDIFGEESILYTGTTEQILQAYQNGEITLEQLQEAIAIDTENNINGMKNAIGDFLIDIGKQFEDFEVKLKIQINTGNIVDKIKNAMTGITGGKQDLGEITITSDAISNTLSTLGNALKSTDLNFDFSYMPKENNFGGDGNSTDSSGGYTSSGGGSGSKNSYSADDAASDLKDILNDIEKYEEEIELDLEDQTEQFINQEMLAANRLDTLKEELDYYNDIYDVTENTSKWLETQNKLLDNQSKKVGSLQNATASIEAQRKKLIDQNSQYNVSSWFDSEGNDTLAYGDLINSFEYQKEAIERETASKMRDVYNGVAGSTSKDAISSAKDKIKQLQEEGDIRIKALEKEQKKVENIHDSVSQLNDAWKDNQDAIREALQELHDLVKSVRDELLDDITEQLENAVDRANTSLDKSVTRMEQLVSIQEKYNDILNDCIDTQDELDSELQSSLDSFEYLDEQMRELMFNEKDYKVLSDTLEGIQEDIAKIWEDHYNQIDELTDDTMYKAEYITSETERQLDMKMQEYELAKAELDVAKARTNLQNVQNERNVRMFVDGQWVWTANPDDVKSAQQQLADAERAKNKIEREAEQKRLLDKMNQMIDSDNLQIDENNELLERIQNAIEDQTTEIKSIEDALANASGEDLPALNDVLSGAFGRDGGDFKTIMANLNKGQTELIAALGGTTTAQAEAQLKSNNMSKGDFEALVKRLGYGWDEKTGTVTTWDGSFNAHYKGWGNTSNPNAPLGTASNGASVTGGNSGSSANANSGSSGSTSGGGNNTGGFPRSGRVSTSSLPLRIRSGAGTNYKVLGTMPRGASVTITGEAGNGWAKVSYNGINGYASKQYLTYDQGGLAQGKGIFLKDVNVPERVLSPKQTKSFDTLVKNLTTNPVLATLTKNVKGTSNLNGLMGSSGEAKQYYFSNFTVKADNLTEFIDSLEGMIPIANK